MGAGNPQGQQLVSFMFSPLKMALDYKKSGSLFGDATGNTVAPAANPAPATPASQPAQAMPQYSDPQLSLFGKWANKGASRFGNRWG